MKALIYIDEFGTSDTEVPKQGNSSHFIYAGLVLREEDRDRAEALRQEISATYFNGGVIKSKKIKDEAIRLEILREIKQLKPLVFALVIDKAELEGQGLQYKPVFYKFFQRMFIEKLESSFDQFEIAADKVGGTGFQFELVNYMERNVVKRDLFNQERYFTVADDKNEAPLIQFADFIAGSLGRVFSTTHLSPAADKIIEELSNVLIVDFFPFQRIEFSTITSPEIDQQVSTIAAKSARRFLGSSETLSLEKREIVKYLLIIHSLTPDKLISTQELVSRVQLYQKNAAYSKENLRQHVGELRDEGVLIASIRGKYGYKLPNKLNDVALFFKRYLDSVLPMLKRIKIADETLKIESHGNVRLNEAMEQFSVIMKLIGAAGV